MPSDLQVTNIKANDGTAGLVIADSTGNVSLSGSLSATSSIIRPAFLVQAQAMSNTSVDTYVDVQYFTVIKNEGGGTYNTGTYTYTAPVSGLYYISASVFYDDFPNNVTDFRVNIVTSNRTYEMRYAKFINAEHSSNYSGTFRNSTLADLDANDTVKIQTYQNAGSAAADLTNTHSYFSGFLVCNY